MPWFGIVFICVLASWYSLTVVGIDALLAPVLKTWAVLKPFLFTALKAALALALFIWFNVFGKLVGWLGELFALLLGYLGGLKAWSAKKMLRQSARFAVSFTARFFLISVLLNLLFGEERKGVKLVPKLLVSRLKDSIFGRPLLWWQTASERQKRLVLGVVLCVILVFAGHAVLGFSILLFDLLWEIVILLARLFARFWRFLWPMIARLIPNFIGNFVTRKVVPLFADVLPVIRNDHRIMYLRFNLRRHFRNFKAALYRRSRSKRSQVRRKLRPYVSEPMRRSKSSLLSAATRVSDKKEEGD